MKVNLIKKSFKVEIIITLFQFEVNFQSLRAQRSLMKTSPQKNKIKKLKILKDLLVFKISSARETDWISL